MITKMATMYYHYYVAHYYSSPAGESELHEWALCRNGQAEGHPIRVWGNKADAETWIDEECAGNRDEMREFIVITKEISFEHGDFMKITNLDQIL